MSSKDENNEKPVALPDLIGGPRPNRPTGGRPPCLHDEERHDGRGRGPRGQRPQRAPRRRPRRRRPPPSEAPKSPQPRCREEVEGTGDDRPRGVLQGRSRALELAHDRADAHHLRLLSALHEAPADKLAKATALKVHLFGSLSATGKGHGTERAALAGIIGKEPATIDPAFLDELAAKPDQTFPVKLGSATFNASLKDIIYDAPEGGLPAPQYHDVQAQGG
jgi:hypothetical protein